ncbi:hypothetical protein HK101_005146 [Irineochytrium annulatum]|nr:hypothetical protein HK101_005146 [Irineochytrium annulatum]
MLATASIGVAVNVALALLLHSDGVGVGSHHGHSHGGGKIKLAEEEDGEELKGLGGHAHAHGEGHGHLHGHGHGGHAHGGDDEESVPAKPRRQMNINVRSAALHVLGDLITSIGVLLSSVIIMFNPSMTFVDPVCTILFAIFVVVTTVPLFWENWVVLMQCESLYPTPDGISTEEVRRKLLSITAVVDVHDLHIWTLTQDRHVLTAHLTVSTTHHPSAASATQPTASERDDVSQSTAVVDADLRGVEVAAVLKRAAEVAGLFGIRATTFQVEPDLGKAGG